MKVEIRDYPCFKGTETKITPEIKEALGLEFPRTYLEAEPMARAAEAVRKQNRSPYAVLPFCHTVEGEAMGGRVNYGDEHIGPRGAEPILQKLEEALSLPDFDLEKGRIREVLDAISLLKQEGGKVCLELSGFVTLMNIVIDPKAIFIGMRRQPEVIARLYEKISANLLNYMAEAWRRGADLISYADSAAAVNILGSRMLADFTANFTYPFLKKAEREMSENHLIHLCPKTAYALIDCGFAETVDVAVAPELMYGEALETVRGQEKFIASRCMNMIQSLMNDGKLSLLRLK